MNWVKPTQYQPKSTQNQLNKLELGQNLDLDIKSVIPLDKPDYVRKHVHRPDKISWTSHEDINPFWTDLFLGIGTLIWTIFVLLSKILIAALSIILWTLGQLLLGLVRILSKCLSIRTSGQNRNYRSTQPKNRPTCPRKGPANIFIQNNIYYHD